MDEIEKKMWKKRTNSKPRNFEKKIFHISIFFKKRFYKFSEFVNKISNPSNRKHFKKFHNFWQLWISEIEKKDVKNVKKKKEIVNDGCWWNFFIFF